VLARLEPEYGPLHWTRRREPVAELIVTILSQHTSDVNAARAFDELIATFGSLDAVAQADVDAIEDAVRGGGLAQQKAPRIKAVLNRIRESQGTLSLDFLGELLLAEAKAWLTGLPGVGPKTAGVVLCFAFNMPAMAVDTHVHRVAKRLRLIGDGVSADKAHDLLEAVVAPEDVYRFHVYMITHGRRVCGSQRPLCESCALADGCPTGRERLTGQDVV
jgi:endonuclease-3